MSYSSNWAGRVRIASALIAADQPADAVIVRDVVVNNLHHLADSHCAQVRVAWCAMETAVSGAQGYLTPTAIAATTTTAGWTPIVTFGPWPIPVRASGFSYNLRVRIAGASSDNVHAIRFIARLVPANVSPMEALDGDASTSGFGDSCYFTNTTTSSTTGWLAGQSGAGNYSTQLRLEPADLAGARTVTSVLTTATGTVEQCLVKLVVGCQTANVAATPRLTAVYAAEFVG